MSENTGRWLDTEDLVPILTGVNELQRAKAPHRGGYAVNLACYALDVVPRSDPLYYVLGGVGELLRSIQESWPVKEDGEYVRTADKEAAA